MKFVLVAVLFAVVGCDDNGRTDSDGTPCPTMTYCCFSIGDRTCCVNQFNDDGPAYMAYETMDREKAVNTYHYGSITLGDCEVPWIENVSLDERCFESAELRVGSMVGICDAVLED